MEGLFACPECGAEVSATRGGPGRQVRCSQCSTLVEVPFIVRTPPRRRGRSRAKWKAWAATAAALAVALVATIVIAQKVRSLSIAISKAHTTPAPPALDLPELERRLAEAQALEATDPAAAVLRFQSLLSAIDESPEFAELHDRAREHLIRSRGLSAEADLAGARAAVAADPAHAIALCERATHTAADLPPGAGGRFHDEARALVADVASRLGVLLEPVHGQFRLGSPTSYNADLHPRLAKALRAHGFVSIADGSPFHALWLERAPYRMSANIIEKQNDVYQQSKNRISELDATFVLSEADRTLWRVQLTASTEVPLPNLAAYEATRLALAPEQSPAVEQRFYQSALTVLRDKLTQRLRDLPSR